MFMVKKIIRAEAVRKEKVHVSEIVSVAGNICKTAPSSTLELQRTRAVGDTLVVHTSGAAELFALLPHLCHQAFLGFQEQRREGF